MSSNGSWYREPMLRAPSALSPTRLRAIEAVRSIVLGLLGGLDAEVWLFGSCARGDVWHSSDIDVAIEPNESLPPDFFGRLREALESSTVPYRVEVVDLRAAAPSLREAVASEGIRWR